MRNQRFSILILFDNFFFGTPSSRWSVTASNLIVILSVGTKSLSALAQAGFSCAECAGFDHGGQSLLGGGERLVRNGSTFRDPRLEFELGVRAEVAVIQVVLVESGPDTSGQEGRGGQASDVSRRGVLLRRASANSTSRDAQAGEAPVIRGERRADETAEGVPDVDVGLGHDVGLKRGRDSSA